MASSSERTLLDPASAGDDVSKQKAATIQIAKEQEKAIHEKLTRNNHPIPKFEFLELIGKGTYGRVFKAYDQINNRIVALKVIDVDSHDYKVNALAKDESIEVTMHEIKVLKQLKENNTKNVNIIFDAFQIHSQLWIVNEYCPGGSVRTLMRGTSDKLEEKYIVPIARELAIALKAIHDQGIIHRDVKAANVMIHEDGKLQVIDFGVAGVLQTNVDKRSTVIGTAHWMAPEMHKLAPPEGLNYGTEVDVWAYGCTLYEIATGWPPYPKTQPGRVLGMTLGRSPPRLDKTQHSEGLCDLVAFVLEAKPADRPSMQQVLQHPYIVNSEDTHPTQSLVELVKLYYRWEHSGGQRQSLFINAGAAAAEFPATLSDEEDWNFSTTSNFEKKLDGVSFDPNTASDISNFNLDNTLETSSTHATDSFYNNRPTVPIIVIPKTSLQYHTEMADQPGELPTPTGDLSPIEKLNNEERVKRGEKALKGLFNEGQTPYEYKVKADFIEQKTIPAMGPLGKPLPRTRSDLPLRDESVQSSVYRKELDANQLRSASYNNTPNIDLANVGTIKANRMNRFIGDMGQGDKAESTPYYGGNLDEDKRATKEWTFPPAIYNEAKDKGSGPSGAVHDPKRATIEWGFPPEMQAGPKPSHERPMLKHTVTAPVGDLHSVEGIIDLDALYDSELYDSDILRTAPVSDDEGFSGLVSEDEPMSRSGSNEGTNPQPTSDDDKTIQPSSELGGDPTAQKGASTASSEASSEIGNEYDPFLSDNVSDEGIEAEVNAYLDRSGVTDALDRTALRREYLKARKTMPGHLKKKDEDAGYGQYKKRSPVRPSQPDFPLPGGLPTQIGPIAGSSRGTKADKSAKETAFAAAAAKFPEIVPPSAESLMADAPASIVEAELKRLMEDWMTGLEVLGEVFDSTLDIGSGGPSGAGGNTGNGGEESDD